MLKPERNESSRLTYQKTTDKLTHSSDRQSHRHAGCSSFLSVCLSLSLLLSVSDTVPLLLCCVCSRLGRTLFKNLIFWSIILVIYNYLISMCHLQ